MFPARISFVAILLFLYCVVGHPQGGLINSQVSDNFGFEVIHILMHNITTSIESVEKSSRGSVKK